MRYSMQKHPEAPETERNTQSDIDVVATLVDDDDLEQGSIWKIDELKLTTQILILELLGRRNQRIRLYIGKARAIETDKSHCTTTALNQGTDKMEIMGAPRKVIIFTESKTHARILKPVPNCKWLPRQNRHLQRLQQSSSSYRSVSTLAGRKPRQRQISGSPQVDRRTALIDHFKHHAEVMIATEAAAEGVNLPVSAHC